MLQKTRLFARLSSHTAKNVILAGVKSVTVFDPEPVEVQDLSSQVSLTRLDHLFSH